MVDCMKSFLSPHVYHLICEIPEHIREIGNNEKEILARTVLSERIGFLLQGNGLDLSIEYDDAIVDILPVFKWMRKGKVSNESGETWWNCWQNASEWLQTYKSCPDDIPLNSNNAFKMLFLLRLTATIERALGDLLVLSGKTCPFLLRDLVTTRDLISKLGIITVKLLRICIGSPLGLNLRNLAWHGFMAPEEVSSLYLSLLLYTCEEISLELNKNNLLNVIPHRPIINKIKSMEILEAHFNSLPLEVTVESFVAYILQSSAASPIMVPYFEKAVVLYENKRYGDCVVLLLPCLENMLRIIFATCNHCEHRILTAESSALYTTLDEILAQFLDVGKENEIRKILGDELMVLLIDLFFMLGGPRLRDRLSHGEMAPEILTQTTATIIQCIILYVAECSLRQKPQNDTRGCDRVSKLSNNSFSPAESRTVTKENSAETQLLAFKLRLFEYRSLFHPFAIVKRIILDCVEKTMTFDTIPFPDDFVANDVSDQDPGYLTQGGREALSNLLCNELRDSFKAVGTLYRSDKVELAATVLLRHIVEECRDVAGNMVSFLRQRWQSHAARSLRSRQRANYRTMIIRLPAIRSLLRRILKETSERLLLLDRAENVHNPVGFSCRGLKALLKLAENLRTLSARNKWEEICLLPYPE